MQYFPCILDGIIFIINQNKYFNVMKDLRYKVLLFSFEICTYKVKLFKEQGNVCIKSICQ